MLKTTVKASQISNLTDARYFAAWEVNYIGFYLEGGHPETLPIQTIIAMKEWLEGPQFVGEFGAMDHPQYIQRVTDTVGLDAVQVPMFCPLDTLYQLHENEIPIIQSLSLRPDTDTYIIDAAYAERKDYIALFLLDIATPWRDLDAPFRSQLQTWCALHPTLVDIPIAGADLDEFLEKIQPKGLAVKGGEEEKVGYKSFDEMDDIFEALEIWV